METISKTQSDSQSASSTSSSGAGKDAAAAPSGAASISKRSGGVGGSKIVMDGITFDDVLLIPQASNVMPATASTSTRLTKDITLNIPMVSAPMDTVTESDLAIALAQEGGIGIIHKNLPVETQAREVIKVKRSANGVITDPITLGPDDNVERAIELMHEHNVSGFPITENGSEDLRSKGKLIGILTRRDLKFARDKNTKISEVMTGENLVTAGEGTTLAQAEDILNELKVEKLLLVDKDGCLAGLITMRDIERQAQFPNACVDKRGRLRVGAAVGPNQFDRVEALIEAEVDVLVVDTAHGHSGPVIDTVRAIKEKYDIGVIAGNIATGEAAIALAEAGADAVKVGIGPGSICTTRVVTGVGMPQVTAIMNAVEGLQSIGSEITVIADGGIRLSGDIAKAIAAGAHCVMMGSLFAGLDESPGELVISGGRRFKSYRGMGSEGAMNAGSADRYRQAEKLRSSSKQTQKFVPEGVEGLVAYRGTLAEFTYQLVGGLRSAMGYCGCPTIEAFRNDARFVKVSGATVVENHPHDIKITKESPNYTIDQI
jgi:IMP dehydrogenase